MKTKKLIICILVLTTLLISFESYSQNIDLSNVNNQVRGVWSSLKLVLQAILGIAGGIFLVIAGIMYFTSSNAERSKNFAIGGIVGLVAFAILSAI
tara:strand:+ start:45 stop:332 length:288 start_codon:yes stop_codon:yes gene_type:complete